MALVSAYVQNLSADVRDRYNEKMVLCGNRDPFLIQPNTASRSPADLPKTTMFDNYNYLIDSSSWYTRERLRAYKSLESYKLYEGGWVKDLHLTSVVGSKVIAVAKVHHSQRLNEKKLICWALLQCDGVVLCGHCTCIAGLGEVCTHVGALLFTIESLQTYSEQTTRTDVLAKWPKPSTPFVAMKRISEIRSDLGLENPTFNTDVPPMDDNELIGLLKNVEMSGARPVGAILFSEHFPSPPQPDVDSQVFMAESRAVYFIVTNQHFDASLLNTSLIDLRQGVNMKKIIINNDDVQYIEKITRGQSTNTYWKVLKVGRVTASLFKQVCRTSIDNPSMTVIKRICWPHTVAFQSASVRYGCAHEEKAFRAYSTTTSTHTNVKVEKCGLFLDTENPYFDASPDGVVSCDCCGKGCIEIKCPFCLHDGSSLSRLLRLKDPYITFDTNTQQYALQHKHVYYYQVQMQMFVTKSSYCDFVIWSKSELKVIRVLPNAAFWDENKAKANAFIEKVILPEMMGSIYTRPTVS